MTNPMSAEITPEMIEAGREFLWDSFCPAIRREAEDDEHYSMLAKQTYRKMQSASVSDGGE